MQDQLRAAQAERREALEARVAAQQALAELQRGVRDAQARADEARRAAGAAQAEAAQEARQLDELAAEVKAGTVKTKEAIERVEAVLARLPKGSGAHDQLLGMQLGVAVSAREKRAVRKREAARAQATSDSEDSDSAPPEAWLPRVGETVLVRAARCRRCARVCLPSVLAKRRKRGDARARSQVKKMGGVRGRVTEPPRVARGNATVGVQVAGLGVTMKLSQLSQLQAKQPPKPKAPRDSPAMQRAKQKAQRKAALKAAIAADDADENGAPPHMCLPTLVACRQSATLRCGLCRYVVRD